ncbi:MAG TPA: hypothetical protein VNM22_01415 [Candidatus Limnocylindrales bacterium]|nr:hypothetical protein [Candidatus Limnocylindrales bacterium]
MAKTIIFPVHGAGNVGVVVLTLMVLLSTYRSIPAQSLPIPQIQPCKNQLVQGKAIGSIASRKDENHSGEFTVTIEVKCHQGQIQNFPYHLEIDAYTLNDTQVRHRIAVDRFDQLTSLGKAVTPTVFLTGTCTVDQEEIPGCRFWLMLVDNKEESDMISFLIVDGAGKRIAYGTGSLKAGDIGIQE